MIDYDVKTENISLNEFSMNGFNVGLAIRREDLLGKGISGNKFRKLKYNILKASDLGFKKVITFGGAFSNHILAASYLAKLYDFEVIGVIRGEELANTAVLNPTLAQAKANGMRLDFVTRAEYKNKEEQSFLNTLKSKYGEFYLLPEGGTNDLAIKGCEEIITDADNKYDYVCCAVGTGGTVSGLINAANDNQKVLGFAALKGDFLTTTVEELVTKKNWEIYHDYHFGGYAKVNAELIAFINDFKNKTGILLDPIYTGKMMYGIMDLIKKRSFPKNTSILAIHTGGIQAIEGMNQLLFKKGLPQIEV